MRIQYRTSVRYYSGQSVDEIVELYRTTTPALDLPGESEQGTDADGDLHHHRLRQLQRPSRSTDLVGEPVGGGATEPMTPAPCPCGYDTITRRVEAAVPTRIAGRGRSRASARRRLREHEREGVALAGDPYVQPVRFSADLTATATLASATSDEAAELSRLADSPSPPGTGSSTSRPIPACGWTMPSTTTFATI
ncbi:MAG: hypothetical protein R2710_10215 [Acidimicrobiales bacterium]